MKEISQITRRDLFDTLRIEDIWWAGELNEIDFLSRLYDLESMPSNDYRFSNALGDIYQHRVNNSDWDDYWVFDDERFNLLKCQDAAFLNFLCMMIHPVIRRDSHEVDTINKIFNDILGNDSFEIVEITQKSNKPIFNGKKKFTGKTSIENRGKEIRVIFNADYVTQQINSMESLIEPAPYQAIGIAKELIETACKEIFISRQKEYDKSWDLSKLMKETAKLLKLTPDDISDEAKAAKSIRQILGSLASIVQGIAEVRNDYGSGHGKDGSFKGLQPRHAKLAAGSASTLAVFLLETHEIRQ
ncbi:MULTISPECIES: abortive infection family protein [unclassified Psychrobacter]|uniref:abortive infection family protein n=1 Tax=unclassified Psychrobacter TaxID=196806 RepID=UPI0018F59DB5|nr:MULTISPECIES: abortive infection family protein [unclassified Psychrobacter]